MECLVFLRYSTFYMEFPPEIVDLIRQYSMPCFKYFREYKRLLRLNHLSEWTALREMLCKSPEEVLPVMLSFEKAMKEFDPVRFRIRWDTWSREDEEGYYEKRDQLIEAEKGLYGVVYP